MQNERACFSRIGLCLAVLLAAAGPVARAGEDRAPAPVHTTVEPLKAVSPDGIYQATTTKDGRVEIRRTRDGKKEKTFFACRPMVLAFSSDSSFLASVGAGKRSDKSDELTLWIWPLKQGEWPAQIKVPGTRADAMAGSGDRVLVSSDSGIYCYRRSAGRIEWIATKDEGICDLTFSNDGQAVLVSFLDGSFQAYDSQSGVKGK